MVPAPQTCPSANRKLGEAVYPVSWLARYVQGVF